MKFNSNLFEPVTGLNLNEEVKPTNSSSESLTAEEIFNKEVETDFNIEVQPDLIQPSKKQYKEYKIDSTVINEDNSTTKPLEEVEVEEGKFTWEDARENVVQTIGTDTANFYDGIESLMINFATKQTATKVKAMNSVVGLFTNSHISNEEIDEAIPEVKDKIKEQLSISKHINEAVGFHYMNNIEEINEDYDRVEQKRKDINNLGLDAIHTVAKVADEVALLRGVIGKQYFTNMFTKTMRQVTQKDLVAQSAGMGTVSGTQEYSMNNQHLAPALGKALETSAYAMLFGEAFKGAVYAKDNLLVGSAEKVTRGLEQHAIAGQYQGIESDFLKWKEDFVNNSAYATWEDIPHHSKQIALFAKSQMGISMGRYLSRAGETADSMKNIAVKTSQEIEKVFDGVDDLAKKVYTDSGLPVPDSLTVSADSTTTYGHHIIANSGIIKRAPTNSGQKPINVGSAHWDIYEAVVAGNIEANRGKLVDAMRVLGVQSNRDIETLLLDSAGNIQHPVTVFADDFVDDILQDVGKEMGKVGQDLNPELLRRTHADDKKIIEASIEEILGDTRPTLPSGELGDWEINLSPKALFDIRQALKRNAEKVYGADGVDSVLNQVVDDTMINSMTKHFGEDGEKFANTLRGILDIERTRADLISKGGIKLIADSGHLMSPQELQKAFYQMRNMGQDNWDKVIASLRTRAEQEQVEMYYLKSVAYKGHDNMTNMLDELLHGTSKGGTSATRAVKSRAEELDQLVMHTLKGRQMHHSLKYLTTTVDSLTEGLPTLGESPSIYTEIYKGINKAFHRVLGSVGTTKYASSNSAYVLSNMEKLMKNYTKTPKLVMTKESLAKAYAQGEKTVDLDKFPVGLEVTRMLENLKKLQGLGKNIGTPPTAPKPITPASPSPTPPLGGVAPLMSAPMPSPTPVSPQPTMPTPPSKGIAGLPVAAVKSIVDTGRVSDHVFLAPADLTALENIQDDIFQKMLTKVNTDHQAGTLPNATNESSAEWIAYNKEIAKAQEGSGMKIVINPAGEPRVILGVKGVSKALDKSKIRETVKNGQTIVKLSDVIDQDILSEWERTLNAPDMFKYVEIDWKDGWTISKGQRGNTPAGGSLIEVGTKGKSNYDEESLVKAINETLMHEVQHHSQKTFGLSRGGDGSDKAKYSAEVARRMDDMAKKYNIPTNKKEALTKVFNGKAIGMPEWKLLTKGDTETYNLILTEGDARAILVQELGVPMKEALDLFPFYLHYSMYRQLAGEAESKFVEALAKHQGVDLSNNAVFDNFIESQSEYLGALWTLNPDYTRLRGAIPPAQ